MKIEINKRDKWWYLKLGANEDTKYGSLFKLAKALMAYARGQNL